MKRILIVSFALLAGLVSVEAQNVRQGYYKDLFIDSGIGLEGISNLPAAKLLGLSVESLLTNDKDGISEYEKKVMRKVIAGSDVDSNGALLYPDGSPRFKMVFVQDGGSGEHDLQLGEEGCANVRAFSAGGGRILKADAVLARIAEGDSLMLFAGMLKSAMQESGEVRIKGSLTDGEERAMIYKSADGNPDYACLGDRQYHHFTIDIPRKTKEVLIELRPDKGALIFDLSLFAASGAPAFSESAQWCNVAKGASKTLVVRDPKARKLYISVFCETTVSTKETACGTQYYGRTEVLNGVPYFIKASIIKK